MNWKMKIGVLLSFLLLLPTFPLKVGAYSSVTVPVSDPVYRKLGKLEAFGLILTMIHGQRPFVRREIARLIGGSPKKLSGI